MFGYIIDFIYDIIEMRKYRLNTKLDSLSLRELRMICKFGIEFCGRELGINNRHSSPISYSILRTNKKVNELGEFCPDRNKIIIYRHNIDKLDKFIKVFIHEYTHSIQPIKSKYYKMLDKYGYDDHPFEIEADNNSKKLFKKFLKEFNKSL